MVLKMADQAEIAQVEYKPWEVDDEGNRVRFLGVSGDEAKPWNFDDPDLVPLDVEHMVNADKQLTDQVIDTAEKNDSKAGTILPEWLGEDSEHERVETPEAEEPEAEDRPALKPWEVEE